MKDMLGRIKDKPLPGSNEAIAQGCTCGALDNNHGKGMNVGKPDDPPLYWMDYECPLHGAKGEWKEVSL